MSRLSKHAMKVLSFIDDELEGREQSQLPKSHRYMKEANAALDSAKKVYDSIKEADARTFDRSEMATVLAALRMFQQEYEGKHGKVIRADWPEHFTTDKGGLIPPLSTEDIDTLCERINCEFWRKR